MRVVLIWPCMRWVEEDWADKDATSHRGSDECGVCCKLEVGLHAFTELSHGSLDIGHFRSSKETPPL